MKIEVFNVEHGSCIMVTMPNGKRIMFDAGSRFDPETETGWWPSVHFFGQQIEQLVIQNCDNDHVKDYSNVMKYCAVNSILHNHSLSPEILELIKQAESGSPSKAVQAVADDIKQLRQLPFYTADLGNVQRAVFANTCGIGEGEFLDTNNLSLVTFLQYGSFTIAFTGDMEKPGWRQLLKNPWFKYWLSQVTVLVASHHGREYGYCEDIFEFCKPHMVIISDKPIEHDTQKETTQKYRNQCSGIYDFGEKCMRYVYTTRDEGKIEINVDNPYISDRQWYWVQTDTSNARAQRKAREERNKILSSLSQPYQPIF